MSVEDETWDRPECEFCKKIILYGDRSSHRNGDCLNLGFVKRVMKLDKNLAKEMQQYFNRLNYIISSVQQAKPELDFSHIISSLKHHAK